jgi:NADH-quinone oxidoreductase subunit N
MVSGLCFWSTFLFIKQKKSSSLRKHNKELGDLVLLKESNPMLASVLAITLFSITGIPPLVGFLAKIGVFLVVIQSSAYLIALISVLLSITSTFYYIRVVKILYFENLLIGKLYHPIKTKKALIIAVLSLPLIILSVQPMMLYLVFNKAGLLIN